MTVYHKQTKNRREEREREQKQAISFSEIKKLIKIDDNLS